jgi:predicted nucleic acid-binding Zn ribbon protein
MHPEYRKRWHPDWSDEQVQRWDWEQAAKRDAGTCVKCGRAIGADEPVWIGISWLFLDPDPRKYHSGWAPAMCHECAGEYEATGRFGSNAFGPFERLSLARYRVGSCEGCGRSIHRFPTRARHWLCSDRCGDLLNNQRQIWKRAAARAGKICTVCGESFDPGKSNAVTCSQKCRQKAYRQRAPKGESRT